MGYVDTNLKPGERVTYRGAISWVIYLMPVMMMGFGAAWALTGGGDLASVGSIPGLVLLIAGVFAAGAGFIRKASSEFAVTTSRVIVKTGLLSRNTIEIQLAKVESIEVRQDILGRLLNYGTMTVVGTGGTKEPFAMIDDPLQFRHAVQALQPS